MKSRSMAVAERDPGRTAYRALLVLLAVLVAAMLALPAGPLTGIVAAQEDPEEEQEEEAPTGPAIKFLNPSEYGEFVAVSDRDMEDHGYHLVATVAELPSNPRVIFEAESSGAGRRQIGVASQEGPDTFGLHWHIPEASEFPRGGYTFRAILFSGSEQVSADEINVNTVQPNWSTVRLDHPSGGGRMGVYLPPGNDARWNTVIDYTFSSETEIVAFFYSLTPPGLEPEWHDCGSVRVSSQVGGGASEPESRRHLCELDAEHDGRELTAVAATATDDPFPLPRNFTPFFGDTSGDAHRVAPYRQLPLNVSLSVEGDEPGIQGPRAYEAGTCTNQILAFLRDQHGRPVAGANVDVHATGPEATEGRAALRFDVSTGGSGTDANQPPDQDHQDQTTARNCANDTNAGQQGNHRNPDGPDTLHIESGSAGTNIDGRFRFRLYNDQPGGTQITAWADFDDDDLYCALEGAAHMSLGWNQAPPPVAGHEPERDRCEIPGLEEALRAQATSHPRSIGINFRRVGGRLQVHGRVQVRTGHAPCARNVPVRVQRRQGNRWRTLTTVSTNQQRFYRAGVADRSGRYRAVAPRIFQGRQSEHLCERAAAARRR